MKSVLKLGTGGDGGSMVASVHGRSHPALVFQV